MKYHKTDYNPKNLFDVNYKPNWLNLSTFYGVMVAGQPMQFLRWQFGLISINNQSYGSKFDPTE